MMREPFHGIQINEEMMRVGFELPGRPAIFAHDVGLQPIKRG
jgi:hypothetical protein